MNNLDFMWNLQDISMVSSILKTFFISICSYIAFLKFINIKHINIIKCVINVIGIILISIICCVFEFYLGRFKSTICLIYFLSILNYFNIRKDIGYSILVTIISLSINYALYIIAVMVSFFPNVFLGIKSEYISLIIIIIIYILFVIIFLKIKKLRYGIKFLQKDFNNEYLDILILNIGAFILFFIIMLDNYEKIETATFGLGFIACIFQMFITIKKSLEYYYKQNLLIKELAEAKQELEAKKQEVSQLEKENLKISKNIHTLAHKQKSLEYNINELIANGEIGEEIDIKNRVEELSKQIYVKPEGHELPKTDIPVIDDMLKYMQSECIENKIEFELQIIGNIYQMTNNYISIEDLETLLADHIKNAIIAINYSQNENRSILVKLGKIGDTYSLCIYDSGIEFEKETLENLGKKPSTTHAESGGTGMGFMNTFDTLRKYKASLVINQYNKPNKEDYTKVIEFKFDGKEKFEVK